MGTSTGATDFFVDFIGSKDVPQVVEVVGVCRLRVARRAGRLRRRRAARSGGAAGSGFPTRSPLRVYTELNGESGLGRRRRADGRRWCGVDGSAWRRCWPRRRDQTRVHVGLNYQHQRGFFIGTGLAWNLPKEERVEAFSEDNDEPFGDYWDWQVRIGYHPGVRVYVPPPPPPPPAAAAAAGARGATT